MSDVASPTKAPETAAHELTLELVQALGERLSDGLTVSADGGKELAEFVIAFHTRVADHYRNRIAVARGDI